MSEFTKICIFCSRDCLENESSDVFNQKRKSEILQQFVKLSERYLKTSLQLKIASTGEEIVESCQACLSMMNSFCNLYHEWKCMEMKLEWKLRQLSDKISSSGETNFEARFNAQCSNEDGELLEISNKFRTDFQLKCISKFSISFPRVSLNRFKKASTKQEACHLNNHAVTDYNQMFLGWVSTLVAVFLLGIGNWLQISSEISEQTDEQSQILISQCDNDDDDDHYEQHQNPEDISSYDITSSLELETEFPAFSDNLESENAPKESDLERSKLGKPFASKQRTNSRVKLQNRKQSRFQKFLTKPRKKQGEDLSTNAQFRCSCCSRNFTSFFQLQCHRRAFTHILVKRKLLAKEGHRKCSRKPKRQSKTSNKIGTFIVMKDENVGVLRPLRKIRKQSVAKDDSDRSSEDDAQESLGSANDDWSMSASDADDTCSSSSSSGSISSDEEMEIELPLTGTSDPRVPSERYACTKDSCVQSFHFKEELDEHLQHHGRFPCSLCDVVEEYAPDLALHESDHMKLTKTETQAEKSEEVRKKSGRVMRYCARCSFSANDRFLYINHYLRTHLKVPAQRIMCRICKAWTADRQRFFQHMKTVHNSKVSDYKREQSPAYFLKRKQLQSSRLQKPKESCNKKVSKTTTDKKQFGCEVSSCKHSFDFKEELEIHQKHHGKFSCQFCKVVKTFAPNLAIHERVHGKAKCKNGKTQWGCVRCNSTTKDKQRYVNHYLKQHFCLPLQRVMCPICKTWISQESLKYHHLTFHNMSGIDPQSVHKCDECDAYFLRIIQLTEHFKNAHGSSSTAPKVGKPEHHVKWFRCDVDIGCRKWFKSEGDLENHRKLHGKFTCSFCPVVESYAPELADHEATHVSTPSTSASQKDSRCRGQVNSCFRCASSFVTRFRYVTHFLETHLNLPSESVTCQNCGAKYSSHNFLNPHIKTQHDVTGMREEDIAKCDQCPAFFRKQIQLVNHCKKRHGGDNATCVDCGRKYRNPYALRTHRSLVHKKKEADFPIGCDAPNCKRRFERKSDVEWHKQITHEGQEKDISLVCHECGKKVATIPGLKSHMQLHGAVRPTKKKDPKRYVCEECGKIFQNQDKLNIDKLSHTGPASWEYTCIFCNKRSATEQKLMEHIRTHTNEKPFICEYCGEEYAHGHNLRNHKNKKHNANDHPKVRKIVNGQESKKGQKLPPRLKK